MYVDYHSAIAFWRKQRGLTQAQLGALIGKSRAQVQAYEHRRAIPRVDTAFAIAAALGKTPSDLFHNLWLLERTTVLERHKQQFPGDA